VNLCSEGGYTVGPDKPLPADPTDYLTPGAPGVLGCNQLRCKRCGAPVRHVVGRAVAAGTTFGEAYAQADLATSPVLIDDATQDRRYLCRCAAWLESASHRMEDPRMPWRCAGHPTVELPHDIDGVMVAEPLEELALHALDGWIPAAASPELQPGARWLVRLAGRLAGTPHRESLARVVAHEIDAPSPKRRSLALQFFVGAPSPLGLRRVLEILLGKRTGFAGVPDEWFETGPGDLTLEDALWRVTRHAVGGLESARLLARVEALAGKARPVVLAALAQHDPDWIAESAAAIARANPAAASALLDACRHAFPPGPKLKRVTASIAESLG